MSLDARKGQLYWLKVRRVWREKQRNEAVGFVHVSKVLVDGTIVKKQNRPLCKRKSAYKLRKTLSADSALNNFVVFGPIGSDRLNKRTLLPATLAASKTSLDEACKQALRGRKLSALRLESQEDETILFFSKASLGAQPCLQNSATTGRPGVRRCELGSLSRKQSG